MRFFSVLLPVLSAGMVAGQRCTNGLPGIEKSGVCCDIGCGTCGGDGCSSRGGGLTADDCCTSSIKDSGPLCSVNRAAPCVIDGDIRRNPTPSPFFYASVAPTAAGTEALDADTSAPDGGPFVCDGILKGSICCSAGCGECGGVGCSDRGNGLTGNDCCTANIRDNGPLCSVSGTAPCLVDVEVGPAPTPTPSVGGTAAPSASTWPPAYTTSAPTGGGPFTCDGILKDDVCCSAGCGQCGGVGCSNRGNGLTGDDCCLANIRGSGPLCSVSGAAPCNVDVAPAPTTAAPATAAPTTPATPAPTEVNTGLTCADTDGILGIQNMNAYGKVCCAATCIDGNGVPQCGGEGCGQLPGGPSDCCIIPIVEVGDICDADVSVAPCVIDPAVEVGPTPMPSPSVVDTAAPSTAVPSTAAPSTTATPAVGTPAPTATPAPAAATSSPSTTSAPTGTRAPTSIGEVFVCDGVLGGDFCCTAGCGTCGGSGCSNRGNGLTGEDCCTSKITQLCSETKAAPCIVDEPGPPPGPSVIPEDYVPADCSLETTISIGPDKSYFSGGGCATLTDLYNVQTGDGPLWVLDSSNKTVDGAGGSAAPTGRWLLTSSIEVVDNVRLEFKGLDRGGDCDVLKIQSTATEFWEVRGYGGSLYFEGTSVTSWDTSADPPTERQYVTGEGRSFLNCVTQYDDSDIYSCDGRSNKNKGTCRMDLIDSTFGNMGWDDSESYGLTWKVRGLCKDLSNLEIFDKYSVYGDILNSDIYGMYYGMYSYGHQGGVWTNNKMHDNIQYGFDPHDDSDDLTIANNIVYNNGNHGIIASKRCNNVKIYNNEVYDGGAQAAGIFLHRSSDNAEVYNNKIYNMQDSGIAWMESFGGKIYDNDIKNCKYGIRLSLGCADNEITNNVFDTISQYGFYTYEGSDTPDVPGNDGRPKNNVFDGNTVSNNDVAVKIKQGDGNIFTNNVFTGVKQFEFPESTGTVWKDNSLDDGCIEADDLADLDLAEGSDPIPVC